MELYYKAAADKYNTTTMEVKTEIDRAILDAWDNMPTKVKEHL